MIRLKDIAQQAGVSVMTVSKVLRDAPDISAETKARIRLLAHQMGYVPDILAQGLRTRKTKLLGAVIPSVTHPVFARVLLAMEDRAHTAGYELVVAHTLSQTDREELVIRRLISRRVDGLLISPVHRPHSTAAVYEELQRTGIPTVILGPTTAFCSSFSCVQGDEFQGAYACTRHLLELGHQRIAFFSGPSLLSWSRDRLEGYHRAMRDAGLSVDDRLVFNAGGSIEEGIKAAEQMLAEGVQATAVQAVNDQVAIGAANTFFQKGWRIPENLSVAGFGNFLISEYYRVPLTTVRQPKHRLGTAAMEMLLRLMGSEKPPSVKLPAELIVRQSTAAVPQGNAVQSAVGSS